MENQQKFTNEISVIDEIMAKKRKADIAELTTDPRWAILIDYRALNGTIIEYSEAQGTDVIRKMPLEELASKLSVTRRTLYDWEKLIPNFWDQVRERKGVLSSQKRLSLMEDKFFLTAMTWKNPIVSIKWMEQNNPNWKDPRFKVEHEVGNSWAALLGNKRDVIEGEVVDANPDN